jgi:hypothetical protein
MADLQAKAEVAAVELHENTELGEPRWKVGRWLTGSYPRGSR